MNLARVVYVSHFAEDIRPADVQAILDVSRRNNPKMGITGVLCYDPRFFLQYFEGPRDAVNDLYRRIVQDERHRDVMLLDYSEIHRREFEDWSMAYVRCSELNKSVILKFSAGETFDPYSMTAEQAMGFIFNIAREQKKLVEQAAEELKRKKKKE